MKAAVQTSNATYLKDLFAKASEADTGVDAIEQARKEAVANLDAWPAPGPRDEEWRQTSLKPLFRQDFSAADPGASISADQLSAVSLKEAAGSTLVFVNGVFSEEHSRMESLPEGCYAGPAAKAPASVHDALMSHYGKVARYGKDAFTAFNTALVKNAAVVFVAKEVKIDNPLHIIHVTDARTEPVFNASRVFIIGQRHSDATIVEDFIGTGDQPYFQTAVSETVLDDESHITHVKIQREQKNAIHISRVASLLGRGSNYNSYTVSNGARIFRNDPLSLVDDENAHATLDGLVLVDGEQVADTHSTLDHLKPNCTSHQLHKVIANGSGKSVFNGKIFVRKDSQQIDAFQENRNLLLSENAEVFTKPQLEIFADDVKCSHGATIGQLSEEELFYLQSRGISKVEAVQMLTYGYALEVIENIPVASLREQLSYAVAEFTGASVEAQDIA